MKLRTHSVLSRVVIQKQGEQVIKQPRQVLIEELEKLLVLEEAANHFSKEQNELIQAYCDDVCDAVKHTQRRWKNLLRQPK